MTLESQSSQVPNSMHDQHNQPFRVMTVCTGNICRSPMAAIVLQEEFRKRGIGVEVGASAAHAMNPETAADVVEVTSSAISDEEQGNPLDPRARRVLEQHGYAIPQGHRAHQVTHRELEQSDLLLPMTVDHERALERMTPKDRRNAIHLYRSFVPELASRARKAGNERMLDLADPWYGGAHEFEVALEQIEIAAPYIVDWVMKQLQS